MLSVKGKHIYTNLNNNTYLKSLAYFYRSDIQTKELDRYSNSLSRHQ